MVAVSEARDSKKVVRETESLNERILVVDDDAELCALVGEYLESEGFEIEAEGSGDQGAERALEEDYSLIVLDVMMPRLDGVEVATRLRAGGDGVAILMLTAKDSIRDRVEGLEAGADDYLTKPFAYEELVARVAALLRRVTPATDGLVSFEGLTLNSAGMEVNWGGSRVDLTTQEFRLLEYFMLNPRIVLSRSRIREAVWDLDADTSSNVVDVYVRYLRQKLEDAGAPPLIQTVRGAGYVLRVE